MRKLYTLLLFLFVIVQIQAKITAPDSNTNTFIPTWKTNNSGSSSDTLITIPISGIDKVPINRVLPIYDAVTPNADGVVYVKKGATGDGSSWASATGELADALLEASTNTAIKQIWVAGGTYSPKYAADFSSADNRDVTFLMQIDVKMYGGFAGTETTLANRDLTLTANKTILSGELGTLNNATDNAYHVVVMTGEAGTAELNGFTITRGYANGIQSLTTTNGNAVNRSFGGAMQLVSASPVLANLEFIANTAKSGGALALLTEANASIQDVVFKNNTADFGGGVTIRYGNTSVFDRVTFSGNSASSDGGAINLVNSVAPVFKNVQVTGNKASRYGGAVLIGDNIASTVIFLNTVFSGNASSDGTIYILTGNITIRNSIMYGNSHGITNNGGSSSTVNIVYSLVQGVNANLANNTINGSIDPLFVSPNAFNNAPSTAGNYALKANSPVINKGANNLYNGLDSNTKDLAGKPRVHNYNNSGTIDIGAYEYQEINADGIIYVNANATGSGTGISWTNAATNLGEALVMAQTLNTNTAGTIKQIWVAGGTYYPKYAVDFSSGFEGDKAFLMLKDVKMYGGFAGTETTLASRDLTITANKTILSGDLGILNNATDNAYHVVVMAGAAGTAELNGFTITGGSAGKGGSLTVNGQTLLGPYGGGLALVAASPVLANLEFVQNTASNGAGLALQSGSNASLQDVVFKNNLAYLGGAVYITSGNTSVFERVTFSGNQANSHGGAIYIGSNSTSVFKNIEISGNKALENGGAVYILNNVGKVSFINSVISGNTSNNGAIYTQGASIIVQNSIIYDNSHGVISSGVSDPNTVVYSLVQNIAADATNHILDGSSPVSFVNAPSYTTAPFSGGDYRLSSGSVGIDAGSNSFFSGLTASSKDLAGKPRIYNYNNSGTIDIGAYEYQGLNTDGIIYVNTNATGSGTGSSWTNAATNLGEALRMAKTLNTSTAGTVKQIWVAGGTYYPKYAADFSSTDNRNKAFVMLRDVKMYGGFAGTETTLASRNLTLTANKTILSGDLGILNNVTDNAYHVVVMADGASNAELNGFTITKGYANGTGYLPLNGQFLSGSQGGGMILVESSPVLSNIQFLENTANAGGALELYSRSNPIIQNTIFKNNIATYGGAVHSLSNNASVFERVTFSGNSAMNGGAIFIGSISTTVFKNTEISGNKANDNGGGVYIINNTSKISFINSVISGNSSNNGAIYTQGASIIVQNSIIYGNSDGIISTGSSDPNTIVYSLVQGINADAANNIIDGSIDPLFVSPNTYSNAPSTTGNYALTANSPLVNKGSNSLYNGLDSNTKDLAGNPRVFDYANAGIIDIGAYESQVFPLVTSAGAQTNLSCNGDNNGSATVNVTGGTVSYSYSWNTNPVQTTATASNLKAGTYIVTVKDALNTIKTQSFTITEPTALTVTPTQTDVACNGSATGSATVSVSGGTGSYTYSWNTTPVQTSATATTLSAGNYIVTITDANNCSTTQSFTITEPTALTVTPTQTDVACNGFATGSATVNVSGGTGSYSYSWNTTPVQTSATATTLAAGNYIVTIKDANNCSITQSFTITEPTALIVTPTQTDVACNGSATGSVTVSVSGGTGSYTYSWNTTPVQTSATATALAAGNYIVTIKDANNCSTTQSFTITEPTALTVTPTQTDVACNGSATGSATVSVSGGTGSYSYSWNTTPVQTSATATALAAGNYIVTIKDANNCSITQSFTITEPTALVVVPTQTDVTCNGFATGSATVNVSGGTGSYSYSWNTTPVQTSATATALAAGNYIVTVKDANNCSTTQSFTIREPTALTVTPTQTDVTCNGSSTGSATVSVSGGTGSYSYSWNTTPIQTSATATGLSAGTYIVTIKDANNCSTTQSFNITEPTAL
ncbi:choice-of-anchor Q domain-containing protein, partial [Flavobacterium sp. LC2016-13]